MKQLIRAGLIFLYCLALPGCSQQTKCYEILASVIPHHYAIFDGCRNEILFIDYEKPTKDFVKGVIKKEKKEKKQITLEQMRKQGESL
jgi:hypothetical protein